MDLTAKVELNSDYYNSSDNAVRTMNFLFQANGYRKQVFRIEVDSPEKMFETLDKYKQPVFSSTGTALTNAGHFIVPFHHSNGSLLVHDPYGNPVGNYKNKNGCGVILDKDWVSRIYNKVNGGRWVVIVKMLMPLLVNLTFSIDTK